MKKLVCISDLHCGHRVGLTPPEYQWINKRSDHIWRKFGTVQKQTWDWYARKVEEIGRPDILVVNADCIDGRGERSGGVELITGDRNEQAKIAMQCIKLWNPKAIVMTRGTAYHTGDIESWEDIIAYQLGCKIGDHEWLEINGVVFDFKHHCGSSSVPYGRKTAVGREQLWNDLWADARLQPRADWIVRSHVHYCEGGFKFRGDKEIWAITTPALQAMGTRYGATRCSGTVDFGLISWDIDEKGVRDWHRHIAYIPGQVARALKF